MRGHTGERLAMGQGLPIFVLIKQNLNNRNSTKSEIFGVDQLIPSVLWTRNFLESQGYGVTENIIYQDNKSTIILEKNGKPSSIKKPNI